MASEYLNPAFRAGALESQLRSARAVLAAAGVEVKCSSTKRDITHRVERIDAVLAEVEAVRA